jgi:predicted  nucleic acid-binding Zn-ribbon protein
MELHIHIHHHGDDKLFTEIKSINSKIEIMGEKLDAIKAELSAINESTNNIAADLDRLAGQISGGLTAEEADSVVADLKATSDKLKAIAAINPETTEPTDPNANL